MADFTLQLLHAADQEGGIPALDDAPRFSGVLNALKNEDANQDGTPDFPNTLVLSSGDAYIPGPFFSASTTAFGGQGRGDILIQNQLGFQAIAFGNHEFDLGTGTVADLIAPAEDYPGTQFPYLSSNLDFSTDESLAGLVTEDGQEASDIPNSIAGNTIITVNGEKIGVVGATTPTLGTISSPGDVGIAPVDFDSSDPTDVAALAAEIQQSVDALLEANPDLNKVILLAHMQQIAIEQQLAGLLRDVDVIVAGGSNTLLADETDRLRAGDQVAGPYPILQTSATGEPVAVVNTDGNYKYVGRLVVDFDSNGVIIPESIDPNISGAYATDEEGLADVNGTPDPEIVEITDALREVVALQEGNIFGSTEVFLNGTRGDVRTQETNLGNLTADANLDYAKQFDPDVVISLKNGGGIRDNIGSIIVPPGATDPEDFLKVPPPANELAGKEEGDISQLDIQNSLRFNNALSLVTLTAEQLLQVIEHGVAATEDEATPGQFPQVGGLAFSFDDDLPAGERVQSLAIQDGEGNVTDVVVEDGELVGDPNRTFRMVTLSFLADGGDGYPFPEFDTLNQVDLATEGVQTGEATFADDGTEQDALAEYLVENFSDTSFNTEDVEPELDTRIQNLDFRDDTVLSDTGGGETTLTPIYEIQGEGHTSEFVGQSITTTGIVTAVDSNGFYLQDATGDGNEATSDGIFVFTGAAPLVGVGEEVQVEGTVSEFVPGGVNTGNLSITQIGGNPTITVLSTDNELPTAVILGASGRIPPNQIIDNDNFGVFDPAEDGIDFYESLEGMRVTVEEAVAVSPTNRFGEIFTLANNGANATGVSQRGTINISPDDFNPERIQLQFDSGILPNFREEVNVADQLGDVTGVVGYNFGNYEVNVTEPFSSTSGNLERETTNLVGTENQLTVASYNVLNLDPNDADGSEDLADGQFAAIASQIVNNLLTPDVIALQEIQDSDGAQQSDIVDANLTYQTLIDAIAAAGGPQYQFLEIPPIDDQSGGEPGGNIRVGYLYNPERVDFVENSLERLVDTNLADGDAFEDSRNPLAAKFLFNGQEVSIVNNHFASKGGSTPLFGQVQPPINGSVEQREAQAQVVNNYVDNILAENTNANVVVLGDLNEFEFLSPLEILKGGNDPVLTNLTETLPENERYSFIFDGNSQSLDHILVSDRLTNNAEFDIVHLNTEFVDQASDHDPLIARLTLTSTTPDEAIVGTEGDDTLFGEVGDDTILGLGGNDQIFSSEGNNSVKGGAGDDIIYSGSGNDLIDGGLGNDTIWLGGGQDIVVLAPGHGTDVINNFQLGQTSIGLSGGLTFEELTISQGDGATLISTGDELLASVSWVQSDAFISDVFVTV